MALNADQKRFLSAALTELEEHLLKFERLLQTARPSQFSAELRTLSRLSSETKLLDLTAAVKTHCGNYATILACPPKL